ncbi:MAG TPA: ATP-binding protein, partial [Puia sp.]|nr:ATP-binding protein [Puia sp.]
WTNINGLADEYLRLAYHGYRAKDNLFNVILRTNYDDSIGKVNIIPQEIGRVLLNLYNNSFYAVHERSKDGIAGYEPLVTISTRKLDNRVELAVRDNGKGISPNLINKIFQPFFTTKPTGQGTGLGLSLSYDIVKSLGGELKVESKEGAGAEFIVLIPVV